MLTGVKMMFAKEKPSDPGKNPVLRIIRTTGFLPGSDGFSFANIILTPVSIRNPPKLPMLKLRRHGEEREKNRHHENVVDAEGFFDRIARDVFEHRLPAMVDLAI